MDDGISTLRLRVILAALPILAALAILDGSPVLAQQARFTPVDLSRFYTPITTNSPALLQSIPRGDQTLAGVSWKIGGYVAIAAIDAARAGNFYPADVPGIPIARKVDRFHLLHTILQAERDGRPIAKVVVHYANGSQENVRLAFAVHVRVPLPGANESEQVADPNSRVAWRSSQLNPLWLFATSFDNPHPELDVATIDFVSLFSRATPVFVGLTIEEHPTAALAAVIEDRITRKAREFDNADLRRDLRVKLQTPKQNQLSSNSLITLVIRDEAASFFFGKYLADASGAAVVPYPPQNAVELRLVAQSPGFLTAVTNLSLIDFPDITEIALPLEQGQVVGGKVVNEASEPLAGASLIVFATDSASRTNLEFITTGQDGRWLYTTRPATLTNLSFEVSHLACQTAIFDHPSLAQLAATNALFALKREPRIWGTITDTNGSPIPNITLTVLRPNQQELVVQPDSAGRFSFIPNDNLSNVVWQILASAPDFAPAWVRLSPASTAAPVGIQLDRGTPLTVRLLDTNGAPAASVKVSLDRWGWVWTYEWHTETDSNGYFTWPHAPTGAVILKYEAEGHPFHKQLIALPATNVVFSFTPFSPAMKVTGKVVDAETGQNIENFRASLSSQYDYQPDSWSYRGSVTGPWQRFEMAVGGKHQAHWRIDIQANGYAKFVSDIPIPTTNTNMTFALTRGQAFTGSVVSEDGTPVAGAHAALLDKSSLVYMQAWGYIEPNPSPETVATDNAGRFRFASTIEPTLVVASHPNFGYAETRVEGTNRTCKVTLHKWGAVRGVLKVGATIPTNCAVSLHTRYKPRSPQDRPYDCTYIYYSVLPGPNGEFFFDKVPPGTRGVYLHYPQRPGERGAFALSHGVPVTVKSGETNEVVVGGTGRTVKGRLDFAGPPLDWQRDVHDLQSGPMSDGVPVSYILRIADDGTFEVPNVPPGAYTLRSTVTQGAAMRELAKLNQPVTIPEGTDPHDLGTLALSEPPPKPGRK